MVNTKTTLSKKVLAIVLAVACMVAFTPAIAFTQSANAASKLKVSPTKATIYVAKTKKISAKGLTKSHLKKVKWTTSKKSVVSISKTKGSYTTAKGKKAGTAYVTAKYGKYKAKAKITVKAYKSLSAVTVSNYSTGDNTAVKVGNILKATVDPSGATVKYQWMSNGTAISGATENTYKVEGAYAGTVITCAVTGTGAYKGTVTSTATPKVAAVAIDAVTVKYPTDAQNATTGTNSNTPFLGDKLTATATSADGTVLSDVTYQWSAGGTDIAGATSASYTVTKTDLTKTITCTVTGKTPGVTDTKTATTEAASSTVTVAAVKASVAVGATMETTLTPSQAANDVTYQWKYSATKTGTYDAILGANSATYTAAKAGYYQVLVANKAGSDFTANNSTATFAVAKTQLPAVSSQNNNAVKEIPARTTNKENDVLAITAVGTLDASNYTIQWYKVKGTADPEKIDAATAATYTIGADLEGYSVYAVVTGADNTDYAGATAETAKYAVTGTIAKPIIAGTEEVGKTLTATAATDSTLQWYRTDANGVNTAISGATSKTYTLTDADMGYTICVVATGTGAYAGTTARSNDTAKVAKNISAATLTLDRTAGSIGIAYKVTPTLSISGVAGTYTVTKAGFEDESKVTIDATTGVVTIAAGTALKVTDPATTEATITVTFTPTAANYTGTVTSTALVLK